MEGREAEFEGGGGGGGGGGEDTAIENSLIKPNVVLPHILEVGSQIQKYIYIYIIIFKVSGKECVRERSVHKLT